jgi:tetratricopeptide (TPR) repeat protein
LTFSSFWVEYHLWGLHALGYHLVNVLLHALNAILVWRLLRRLSVPGALLAAAVFALHPVHVESVAWVAERKNVLSGLFYLLSLSCYMRFLGVARADSPAEVQPSPWSCYALAFLFFLCALASKTVTATLPAAILLIQWWRNGRVGRQELLWAAPFLAAGLGAGLLTGHLERYTVGAVGPEWAMSPLARGLVAGRAFWFYAGKLAWPARLTFIYPRWAVDPSAWPHYLFPLAAVAALAGLWTLRGRIGRGPLAAVLFFAVTLSPALGFFDVFPMRYSYVADHFQYLASLGLIVLAAAGAARLLLVPGWSMPAAGAALLALGVLTWSQAGVYHDIERVWTDTIAKNPACSMAHNNLAVLRARQGRLDDSIAEFERALASQPEDAEIHYNLGIVLAQQGRDDEEAAQYREALAIRPDYAEARNNLGDVLMRQGRLDEAIAQYRQALALQPDYAEARFNLGLALARQGRKPGATAH